MFFMPRENSRCVVGDSFGLDTDTEKQAGRSGPLHIVMFTNLVRPLFLLTGNEFESGIDRPIAIVGSGLRL